MGYELHVTQEQYYLCDHQPWMDMKIFVMKDGISFIEMIVDVSNHDKNETIRMGSSWKLIRPTADYHKEVCDLRFVFNDVDGNSSLAFRERRMEFTMCYSRAEMISIRVDIDLTDSEYDQFKRELATLMNCFDPIQNCNRS